MPNFAIVSMDAIEGEYFLSIENFPSLQHYIEKCKQEIGGEEELVVEQKGNGWVKIGIDYGEEFWNYIREGENQELLNKTSKELKAIVKQL